MPRTRFVNGEFNHSANDSPRSGGSKRVAPLAWVVIVIAIIAIILWFAIRP
jgi:hypothetical protein